MKKRPAIVVYILVALAVVVMLAFAMAWMVPLNRTTNAFKQPKIVGMHVEGEPFTKIKLKPGWHLRPVDIMYGTNALITCEVVRAPMGHTYEASMMGKVKKSKDCRFFFKVTQAIGTKGDVTVTYRFKTKKGWSQDSFTVPYRVIPGGKFIRIFTFEDAAHKPIKGVYCPTQHAYVYGTAALPVHAKGLIPLFFVEDPLNPGPVLQVKPVNSQVRPIAAMVKEFRRYGDRLQGLAFWSIDPISVGPQQADRSVYNVYAGLFREQDVPAIIKLSIQVIDISRNRLRIRPLLHNFDRIRPFAVALTKPWRIIRSKPLKTDADFPL